jgi:PAS domain S-box-containing protein
MLHQPMQILYSDFDSYEFIKRHFAGKNSYAVGNEWQGTHKSGKRIWINVKTNPMFDEKGHVTGIIGVSMDIRLRNMQKNSCAVLR